MAATETGRKIAERIAPMTFKYDRYPITAEQELAEIISVELAEREKKVEELTEAAKVVLIYRLHLNGKPCDASCTPQSCRYERLRAALSGLGVSE